MLCHVGSTSNSSGKYILIGFPQSVKGTFPRITHIGNHTREGLALFLHEVVVSPGFTRHVLESLFYFRKANLTLRYKVGNFIFGYAKHFSQFLIDGNTTPGKLPNIHQISPSLCP